MAPRRSAQRLLAVLARSNSPRAIALGLLGAALLLAAGCGGGSSSSSESSSATASTEASATTASQQRSKPKQGQDRQDPGGADGTSAKRTAKVKVPQGEREPPITPQRKAHTTLANVALESPSFVKPDGYHVALTKSATCEGKNVPPTLRWAGVPEGTKELILFAMSYIPVQGQIFFDWAVAGLGPNLSEIKGGELPPGAILGKNSFGKEGYSICPPEGKGETYVFYLFALPRPLSPKRGFDPARLREEALAEHANSGFLAVTYHLY